MNPRKTNWVDVAVEKVGGMTKATLATSCAYFTIRDWKRKGRVTNAVAAIKLSEATGIDLKKLVGFDGPEIEEEEERKQG